MEGLLWLHRRTKGNRQSEWRVDAYGEIVVEQVRDQPENMLLITKRLYAQTAAHFNTTPSCVERNLRTLIQRCWNYPDHSFLNLIAGAELQQPPTNSQFIDILAAYLRN